MHTRPACQGGIHGAQRVERKVVGEPEGALDPKPADLQVPYAVAGLCEEPVDGDAQVLCILLCQGAAFLTCVDRP